MLVADSTLRLAWRRGAGCLLVGARLFTRRPPNPPGHDASVSDIEQEFVRAIAEARAEGRHDEANKALVAMGLLHHHRCMVQLQISTEASCSPDDGYRWLCQQDAQAREQLELLAEKITANAREHRVELVIDRVVVTVERKISPWRHLPKEVASHTLVALLLGAIAIGVAHQLGLLGFRSEQAKWQQSVNQKLEELTDDQRRAARARTDMHDDVRTVLRGQTK